MDLDAVANRVIQKLNYEEITDRVIDRINREREVELTCNTVNNFERSGLPFSKTKWEKKKVECMQCAPNMDFEELSVEICGIGGCEEEGLNTTIINKISRCNAEAQFDENVKEAVANPCKFVGKEYDTFVQDVYKCKSSICKQASEEMNLARADPEVLCPTEAVVQLQRSPTVSPNTAFVKQIKGENCLDIYDTNREQLCSEKVCATKCAREAWAASSIPFSEDSVLYKQFKDKWHNKKDICSSSLKLPRNWDSMQYKYECNTDRTADKANKIYEIKRYDASMPYQDSLCTVFRGCDEKKNEGDCNRKNGCVWLRGTCMANRIMPCSEDNLRSISCEANCTKPNYRCLRQEEKNILGMKEDNCQ